MEILDHYCNRTILLGSIDDLENFHSDAEAVCCAEGSELRRQLEGDVRCELIGLRSEDLEVRVNVTEPAVDQPGLSAARLTFDPDNLGLPRLRHPCTG